MSCIHRWSLTVVAALALAAPASAQWRPVADAGPVFGVTMALATTPAPDFSLDETEGAEVEAAAPIFVAPPLPGVERTSTDVALMIVGGAALILGSVIGDDAGAMMMVGGGVVGLVGLYQYLT